ILSHLVSACLSRINFDDSDAMDIIAHRISVEEEVLQTFADVLYWLNDEGLILERPALTRWDRMRPIV
ncbi:hypothetical protein ACC870_38610, partial [Rhizobium ruizarguesonis]